MSSQTCQSTDTSKPNESDTQVTTEALARLKKRFGDPKNRGKGTARRKREPSRRGRVDGVSSRNLALTTKLMAAAGAIQEKAESLSEDLVKQAHDYLEPIHQEFLQAVSKGDRKNNKVEHHTKIRQTLVDYLEVAPKIHPDLVPYAVKNLNEQALERVIRLLEIYANVSRNQEFKNYTRPSDDYADTLPDRVIQEAYQTLELSTTEKIDPVSLRHYYLQRRERLYLQHRQSTELDSTTDKQEDSTQPTDSNSDLETRSEKLEAAYLTIYRLLAVTNRN